MDTSTVLNHLVQLTGRVIADWLGKGNVLASGHAKPPHRLSLAM